MKAGRKGYGEELQLIKRYSELSELYFLRLRERLESQDKKDQDLALNLLNGVFVKMLPQTLDGEFTNINTTVEYSPEEHDAVKQAILNSISQEGSGE